MNRDQTVLLSLKFDEGDAPKRLASLVLEIEKTQKAQQELTKARAAERISEEEYAKQSVRLTTQLSLQRAEQASLTKEVTKATPEQKKLGASLLDAARSNDVLGGAVQALSSAKEKYTVAANLAKAATTGEVAVLGALRLALLATGLGAFVVVLGSVITFLTKTQAGADLLSRKMAAIGAVVQVVTNLASDFGQKLVAAADNPKQAFTDLVDFLETNVANRFKAIGVLIDAVRNRDLGKLGDGVIQLTTGLTNGTARAKGFLEQMSQVARTADQLKLESQQLLAAERALNVARAESRAQIEALKKLSDDSSKSVGTRTAAAKQAAQIENGLLAEQQRLQDAKIRNLQATQALQKNLTNEDLDAMAELRKERAETAQESLTLQTELQNKINSLATESADKRIALRKETLDAEAKDIDRRLKAVQVGSDEELRLLQQKLQNSYQAELNVNGLTVKGKQNIDTNYEGNRLALELDFSRKRVQAALQAAVDVGAAELAQQRATGADLLQLQAEQIEAQRRQALAGLAANADNTAATARINAQAAQQQRQLEYQESLRLLQEYLDTQRRLVEHDHDAGLLNETAYQHKLAAINKAGTDAQAVINADYRQDNTANQQQADANEAEATRRHTAEVKRAEEAKQEIKQATLDAAQNYTQAIINLFGQESEASRAAMAVQKVLAVAQIALNLAKQLSANQLASAELGAIPIIGPALAATYLATTDAAAVLAAAVLKLEQGGIATVGGGLIAHGPRHAQGGIPVYHRGQPAGIEIEGGEPVLHRGVSQSPLLLSLASTVNQLAGGRALAPALPASPLLALGGLARPLVQQNLRGSVGQEPIDYERLARALAKVQVKATISDVKAGLDRNAFTESQSSA